MKFIILIDFKNIIKEGIKNQRTYVPFLLGAIPNCYVLKAEGAFNLYCLASCLAVYY